MFIPAIGVWLGEPTTTRIVLVVIIWLKIPEIFYLSILIFATPVIGRTTQYNAFWRAFMCRTGVLSFLNPNPRWTLNTCEIRVFSMRCGYDIIKVSADFNSFLAFLVLRSADFHFLVVQWYGTCFWRTQSGFKPLWENQNTLNKIIEQSTDNICSSVFWYCVLKLVVL